MLLLLALQLHTHIHANPRAYHGAAGGTCAPTRVLVAPTTGHHPDPALTWGLHCQPRSRGSTTVHDCIRRSCTCLCGLHTPSQFAGWFSPSEDRVHFDNQACSQFLSATLLRLNYTIYVHPGWPPRLGSTILPQHPLQLFGHKPLWQSGHTRVPYLVLSPSPLYLRMRQLLC